MQPHDARKRAVWMAAALCCGIGYAAAQSQPATTGQSPQVAAQVGDQTITLSEVDAKAMAADAKAYQALYDARRNALDTLIEDLLLSQEAARRGVPVDELVASEITSKIQPVSDAEVSAYYEANKARMRNQEFDKVAEPIRQFLQRQRDHSIRGLFIESLKMRSNVKIALEPPRVDLQVAQNEPAKGPAGAPVTIVEYVDFQ